MAARFRTIAHTIGAASQTLSSIVNSAADEYISSLTLRAKADNVGNVFWTDSGVAYGGYLDAGEAASFDLAGKFIPTKDIYIAGRQNVVVYITVIG